MNIFIDIALSNDRTIYSWITSVYNLIIKLASYEVFSPEQINGLSRRVYALLGIFMLFKLSFSMISYIVNPDDFADKSKGFGGLIKNVIISMVLIVAVPYIFAEASYVQKMILEDGTIIKMVLPIAGEGDEENSDRSSVAYANRGAGEEISFILFTQFVKPNDIIPDIDDYCERLYKIGDDGKRVHVENSQFAYQLDDGCKDKIKEQFRNSDISGKDADKEAIAEYYIDAMEYQNYNILVNHPEIFKAEVDTVTNVVVTEGKTSKSSVKVIKYNWLLSLVFGVVVLLFLITLCIDVAVRAIKLAFYQIIAPIPIISHCDPKAKKDGMFNKWVKACVATYIDLFIRLLMFFLAIFVIRAFTEKFVESGSDNATVVFIIIGALVFAKQAPKIVEDLTGLKMENFTLNPFKKISNEALGGKALLGAAGGAVAGIIGGGSVGAGWKDFAGRGLSTVGGAVRGAAANKGFGAGISAQADVNRKVRDARIAGAGFWNSRLAGVASTFGLDDAWLEREATDLRVREDIINKKKRSLDTDTKNLDIQKNDIQRKITPKKNLVARQKGVVGSLKERQDNASSLIKGDKAGEYFKMMHNRYQDQDAYVKALGELTDFRGVKLKQEIQSADGKHVLTPGKGKDKDGNDIDIIIHKIKTGSRIDENGNKVIEYDEASQEQFSTLSKELLAYVGTTNTGYYENKIGRDELLNLFDEGKADQSRKYKWTDAEGKEHEDTLGGVGQDKIDHDATISRKIGRAVDDYNDYLNKFTNEEFGPLDEETRRDINSGNMYEAIDLNQMKSDKKGDYAEALAAQISLSEDRNDDIEGTMNEANGKIEELERQKQAIVTDATVMYKGKEVAYEDFARETSYKREEFKVKQAQSKIERERAAAEHIKRGN